MCSALIILSNRLSDEISSALTFVHVNILLKQNGQTIVACNVDLRRIYATTVSRLCHELGWDRKIRHEDHRLASRDLPSDEKR